MKNNGYLFVIAAAVLWGTTGTAQALAPQSAQPLAVGALRLLVGGLALLAYALTTRQLSGNRMASIRKQDFSSILLAAVCMAAYQLLFFAGVRMTGVAVGTIVGIGSSPVLAGALGYLFRSEHPGGRWVIATLLAVIGCALLALSGNDISINPLGMLLAVGAGGAYATFSLASKGLLEHQPVEKVMALVFGFGALLLLPVLVSFVFSGQSIAWLAQPRGIGAILHLGLFATALAYILFGQGLKRVPLATAVTLSLAEPLTAGTLGVVLLGEKLSLQAGLGIVLIFCGLVVLSMKNRAGNLAVSKESNKP